MEAIPDERLTSSIEYFYEICKLIQIKKSSLVFHFFTMFKIHIYTFRRMFPALRFSVYGLNPKKDYTMAIEIVSADNFRYKYHESEWRIAGKAYPDSLRHERMCLHPDSPSNGSKWTATIVSFHKLKVTNNSNGSRKHVSL